MWRADHSFRGVLPNLVRRGMWCRNLKNEEVMTRVDPQRHKKNQRTKTESDMVRWVCTLWPEYSPALRKGLVTFTVAY